MITQIAENKKKISVADSAVSAILSELSMQSQNSVNQSNSNTERSELHASSTAEVEILPELSIIASQTEISEGESAGFIVHSDSPLQSSLLVQIEIVAESNLYSGHPVQTVYFGRGLSSVSFNLETENDVEPENNQSIQVLLKNGSGYRVVETSNNSAIVTINDMEDHNRVNNELSVAFNEIAPIMLNTIGSSSLETLMDRSNSAFTNNRSPQFELNGISELPEIIKQIGETTNQDSQVLTKLFQNSSFSLGFQPDAAITTNATVWGVNEHKEISSTNSLHSKIWDGDYRTHQIGFESVISQDVLAGMAITFSNTQIEYGATDEIQLTSENTNFQSYFSYVPNNQSGQLQIATGYGKINTAIEHESQIANTIENDYFTLAVAGQKDMLEFGNVNGFGNFEFLVRGQYWNAQLLDSNERYFSDASLLNRYEFLFAPESIYQVNLLSGAEISNVTSIGLGANSTTSFPNYVMDFRNQIKFSHPVGLSISGDGKILNSKSNQISNLNINSKVFVDFGFDGLGIQFELKSQFGRSPSENTIPTLSAFRNSDDSVFEPSLIGNSIKTRLGFGLELGDSDWLMTPFSEIGYTREYTKSFSLGSKLALGTNANYNFQGGIENSHSENIDREYRLSGNLTW